MSRRKRGWRLAAAMMWCAAAGVLGSQEPAGVPGENVLRSRCLTCHGAELIRQQRLSRDGWARELDKMAGWGAAIEPADRGPLLEYLTTTVGSRAGGAAAPVAEQTRPAYGSAAAGAGTAADAGASIIEARCVACHDLRLIEQQRLDAAGWRREVDKMIGWGAAVGPEEKEPLVAYLARRYR